MPTMGYLHEGHISLVRRAREECATVIVSVFVNPLQFGSGEDFTRYPRDPERDTALAKKAGADAMFMPEAAELYPEGFATEVRVRTVEDVLEGRMIQDLNFPTRIVVCPTIRESDGLAMSSRNVYLKREERSAATIIPRALFAARDTGSTDPRVLEETVREAMAAEPLVALEYVFANDAATLGPVGSKTDEILLSLAARVGKTRLIDNILVKR